MKTVKRLEEMWHALTAGLAAAWLWLRGGLEEAWRGLTGKEAGWTRVADAAELAEAIGRGCGHVELAADIELEAPLELEGVTLTVDGRGHSMRCRGARQGFAYDGDTPVTCIMTAKGRVEHADGSEAGECETFPGNVGMYRFAVGAECRLWEGRANYVNFSCGWTACTFPVKKLEGGYLYFWSYGMEYSLDFDWWQGGRHRLTEYRLAGVAGEAEARYTVKARQCSLALWNLTLHGGLEQTGGAVRLEGCTVRDCSEHGVTGTGSVRASDCLFLHIWKSAARVRTGGELRLANCRMLHVNAGRQNTGAVDSEADTRVEHCRLRDYGSYGIRIGKVKTYKAAECPVSEVKHCTLEESTECVTDTGAIYVAANNRRAVVRDNVISGYRGRRNNHAIYVDDGAYNVEVTGNTVRDCRTGYAISCREAAFDPESPTYRGYGGGAPNSNRTVTGNVADSGIWFGGSAAQGNVCSGNLTEESTDWKSRIETRE